MSYSNLPTFIIWEVFRKNQAGFQKKVKKNSPDRGTAGGDDDTRVGCGVGKNGTSPYLPLDSIKDVYSFILFTF